MFYDGGRIVLELGKKDPNFSTAVVKDQFIDWTLILNLDSVSDFTIWKNSRDSSDIFEIICEKFKLNVFYFNQDFPLQTSKRHFSGDQLKNNKKNNMPPIHGEQSVAKYVEQLIKENKIFIFSKTTCNIKLFSLQFVWNIFFCLFSFLFNLRPMVYQSQSFICWFGREI